MFNHWNGIYIIILRHSFWGYHTILRKSMEGISSLNFWIDCKLNPLGCCSPPDSESIQAAWSEVRLAPSSFFDFCHDRCCLTDHLPSTLHLLSFLRWTRSSLSLSNSNWYTSSNKWCDTNVHAYFFGFWHLQKILHVFNVFWWEYYSGVV